MVFSVKQSDARMRQRIFPIGIARVECIRQFRTECGVGVGPRGVLVWGASGDVRHGGRFTRYGRLNWNAPQDAEVNFSVAKGLLGRVAEDF